MIPLVDVIREARQLARQAAVDAGVQEADAERLAGRLADVDVADLVVDAAVYVAARVEARYLTPSIQTINPTERSAWMVGDDDAPLRLLGETVRYAPPDDPDTVGQLLPAGTRASRMSLRQLKRLGDTGPTVASLNRQFAGLKAPIYAFENLLFVVAAPGGGAFERVTNTNELLLEGAEAEVVRLPLPQTSDGETVAYDGEAYGDLDTLYLPIRTPLIDALVHHTAARMLVMGPAPMAAAAAELLEQIAPLLEGAGLRRAAAEPEAQEGT